MGNQQTNDFPYEVSPDTVDVTPSGWALRNGWQTSDRKPVSVFIYTLSQKEDPIAMNFYRRFKTLRHPCILPCLDEITLDAKGQICVVTERVRPLKHTLHDLRKQNFVISWGLYSILSAADFLNQKGFVHGLINLNAIYADKQGDWKLGGFELLAEYSTLATGNNLILPAMSSGYIPPQFLPPELTSPDAKNQLAAHPPHSLDAWMAGCLIWSVLNPTNFTERNQLKKIDYIPENLKEFYIALIGGNPGRRCKIGAVLQSPYFSNPMVETCLFLEEINVKEAYEKDKFFTKLGRVIVWRLPTSSTLELFLMFLDEFPEDFCKYKLLPDLVSALDYGSAGSVALTPILKVSKKLTHEEFGSLISPSLGKWFKSTDKALKLNLLENIPGFIDLIPNQIINDSLYPFLSAGFVDPDAAYRTLAVQVLLSLVHKLNESIINTHLLKSLGKLQLDPQPIIRTTTTNCVSTLANALRQETREKVLVAAFNRALYDPHPPARIAGIEGFQKTKGYYKLEDIAKHVVPALSFMTIDASPEVRSSAIGVLKQFVVALEDGQATIKAAPPGAKNESGSRVAGLSSWAFNSISKFYTGAPEGPQEPQQGSTLERGQTSGDTGKLAKSVSSNSATQKNLSDSDDSYGRQPTEYFSEPKPKSQNIYPPNSQEEDYNYEDYFSSSQQTRTPETPERSTYTSPPARANSSQPEARFTSPQQPAKPHPRAESTGPTKPPTKAVSIQALKSAKPAVVPVQNGFFDDF